MKDLYPIHIVDFLAQLFSNMIAPFVLIVYIPKKLELILKIVQSSTVETHFGKMCKYSQFQEKIQGTEHGSVQLNHKIKESISSFIDNYNDSGHNLNLSLLHEEILSMSDVNHQSVYESMNNESIDYQYDTNTNSNLE